MICLTLVRARTRVRILIPKFDVYVGALVDKRPALVLESEMSDLVGDRKALAIGVVVPIDTNDRRAVVTFDEHARAIVVEVGVLNSDPEVLSDALDVDRCLKLTAFAEQVQRSPFDDLAR